MKKQFVVLAFTLGVLGILVAWLVIQPAGAAWVTSQPAAAPASAAALDEVYVPAGPFARGCSPDFTSGITCDADARPINYVYVDAFYIDRLEVANTDYAACVAAGACPSPLGVTSNTRRDYYTNPAYANYPMLQVDWNRAAAYCAWRGQRLPTEAEWEKAARGTDLRLFPWGNTLPTCEMANIAMLNGVSCLADTVPVDSYPDGASPYGAINMVGNVREWVNDIYLSPYYEDTPYYNPKGPSYTDKGEHLVRGGSWADHIDGGSNAWVRIDEAGIYHVETIGFRCARTAAVVPPTATPIPTPTPLPWDSGRIGPEGGVLWVARPGQLTALHVPSGSLTSEVTMTVSYVQPHAAGQRQGVGDLFTLGGAPFSGPAALLLGFDGMPGVIAGTAGVYRLDSGSWVTSNITVEEQSTGHILAWVTQPGTYGVLGETNRVYLPITVRP